MLLRASGESIGASYDLGTIRDPKAAAASGVGHADALLALADAMAGEDEQDLAGARERVRTELGAVALVDAVAVASNFERMVRIADATGIPLDEPVAWVGDDLRRDLALDRFASAARTPHPSAPKRVLGRVLRRLLPRIFRLMERRMAPSLRRRFPPQDA